MSLSCSKIRDATQGKGKKKKERGAERGDTKPLEKDSKGDLDGKH